ncbi:hypothetical protein L195_g060227, partial [Trifolium pratense]
MVVRQSGLDTSKACFGDMYIPTVDDKVKEQIMSAPRASDQGERIIGLCGPDKRVDHSVETAIGIAERHQLFQKIVKATVTKKTGHYKDSDT